MHLQARSLSHEIKIPWKRKNLPGHLPPPLHNALPALCHSQQVHFKFYWRSRDSVHHSLPFFLGAVTWRIKELAFCHLGTAASPPSCRGRLPRDDDHTDGRGLHGNPGDAVRESVAGGGRRQSSGRPASPAPRAARWRSGGEGGCWRSRGSRRSCSLWATGRQSTRCGLIRGGGLLGLVTGSDGEVRAAELKAEEEQGGHGPESAFTAKNAKKGGFWKQMN